jgi:hypothetical protein
LDKVNASDLKLKQTGGKLTLDNNSSMVVGTNTIISGGDVAILNNSSLSMSKYGTFKTDNVTMSNSSTLDVMNNNIDNIEITNSMVVDGKVNTKIDINLADNSSDTINVDSLVSENGGTINISDYNIIGNVPNERQFRFKVFDANSIKNVNFAATDKEIANPIGYYKLSAGSDGYFTSALSRFNPQVFRGQVATLAMYNNQLNIDDVILNHVGLQGERNFAMNQYANKYASAESRFAPYQYTSEDGGLWYKSYVNFEKLSLTNDIRTNNNSYGSIIGADLPVKYLKKGWKYLPTAYVAYNGAHQSYNGTSMYQNGGQAGFIGTFIKHDFMGSIMAYGGGYNNEMSVAGTTDKTGTWFAGTAAKLAYNLHATKHFTVQPTAFVSYNAFGKQRWNSDYGTMGMNSGMMNGISVAPGVNLIYARDTWSLYGTIQYMMNINDGIGGKAGNVQLDDVKMRHGYIQYGIGATKTWKDRLTSYFQVTMRNGGRTGVGFQLGLNYLFDFGNKSDKVKVQKNKPVVETPVSNVVKPSNSSNMQQKDLKAPVPNIVNTETQQKEVKAPIPNVVKSNTVNKTPKVNVSKSSMTSKKGSFETLPNSSKTVIKSLSMNMNNIRKEEKGIK